LPIASWASEADVREQGDVRVDIVGIKPNRTQFLTKLIKKSSFGSDSLDVTLWGDRILAVGYDLIFPTLPEMYCGDIGFVEPKREGRDYTVKWLSIVIRCLSRNGFFVFTCMYSEKKEIVMQRVLLHSHEEPGSFVYEEFGIDVVEGTRIGVLRA
jgi:hypothetical protein